METPRVRAEINLSAIANNVRELRRITHPSAKLMAVVKANAYGHGLIEVASCALKNGAQALGVAEVNEGVLLRKAGMIVPVLILGFTPPEYVKELLNFDLTQSIYSYEMAKLISQYAISAKKKIKIHLKIDTGMGRLGILPDCLRDGLYLKRSIANSVKEIENIFKLKGLSIEGIFTHFASSDALDKTYAHSQFKMFTDLLDELSNFKILPPVKHAANSGAIIDLPDTHLDMVRAGISMYGFYPSDNVNKRIVNLKPAMYLKSNIIHLKKVPAGVYISYGLTYKTSKPTVIATIPVGYADGLNRHLSSNGFMLVHGLRAPIVGRVCMDLTMIDVGHIPDVLFGDEVVIFGEQNGNSISVDEIASTLNTISYEIVSTITSRVPRIYF